MSNHQIDITKNVMSKIKKEQIIMRPKWYFWLGSLSIFFALIGLAIVSIFLISLVTFSLRSHGPMGAIRYQQIVSNFPWGAPIIVVMGMIVGLTLLKKYDFSYRKNFALIIVVVISAVLLAGILVNTLGVDKLWIKRGPMRRFYQQYDETNQRLNIDREQNVRGKRHLLY